MAVLGRNGAGKSSLLHALAGTLATQGGAVRLLDRDLSRWRPRDLATRRAVLTQHSSLPFGLQVLDVVLLGRSPHRGRTTGAKDREVAHQALARTETSHLVSRDYLSLSGGERQRVQWARVLAQLDFTEDPSVSGPRWLLLDEPTSALDLAHQHSALSLAASLSELGIGVLAIVHDPNLAARYADRILLLQKGQVVAEGSPTQVITAPTIERLYGLPVRVTQHLERNHPQVDPC